MKNKTHDRRPKERLSVHIYSLSVTCTLSAFASQYTKATSACASLTYQIAVLELHEFGSAFVLVYGVVVGHNAFAIYRSLRSRTAVSIWTTRLSLEGSMATPKLTSAVHFAAAAANF